jgi:heat shock protein HspQ
MDAGRSIAIPRARFAIGEVVRHRLLDFRGVIFDVDPQFANSDEWYEAIPEAMRPSKQQPFYHLLAENAESSYVA